MASKPPSVPLATTTVTTASTTAQKMTDESSEALWTDSDGTGGFLCWLRRRRPTPRGMALIYMTLAMSVHFFGYEFARTSNLSLFTSSRTGFSSPSAFPLAMACVSPFSFILLWAYGKDIERTNSPRLALRHSKMICATVLSFASLAVASIHGNPNGAPAFLVATWRIFGKDISFSQLIVWLSFVFQNSYSNLLYTQQWSFLGSIVNSAQGATFFASIAGICSISSTLSGAVVATIVQHVGLAGLLAAAAISVVGSMVLADTAYRLSEHHGFDPAQEIRNKREKSKRRTEQPTTREQISTEPLLGNHDMSLVAKAIELFRRVPVLGALFWEVLAFQSLSTVLNVSFVRKVADAVVDDTHRAAWTGEFFALVNAVSGVMQFAILPIFMKYVETRWVWRLMPCVPLICGLIQCLQYNPSLYLVSSSFFAAKVMDYSLRNVANEMVYVPLDFDSRYLGKEIIGVFGNRFGKSGMSLLLSGISYFFGNFGMVDLSRMTAFMSALWYLAASRLGALIPRRSEVENTEKRVSNSKTEEKKTETKDDEEQGDQTVIISPKSDTVGISRKRTVGQTVRQALYALLSIAIGGYASWQSRPKLGDDQEDFVSPLTASSDNTEESSASTCCRRRPSRDGDAKNENGSDISSLPRGGDTKQTSDSDMGSSIQDTPP